MMTACEPGSSAFEGWSSLATALGGAMGVLTQAMASNQSKLEPMQVNTLNQAFNQINFFTSENFDDGFQDAATSALITVSAINLDPSNTSSNDIFG